jgi:DNA-binding HxlR family transcriptional regulator
MRPRASPLRTDAGRLAGLFHHAWSAPLLAELLATGGSKVVTLSHRLAAPRDSVRRTLEALAARGLARRNPGYGHPMRPEWVLTAAGARLAPACAAFLRGARGVRADGLSRRKWAVPVLLGLLRGTRRFSGLGAALPRVTARALAATLKEMEASGVVERRVLEGRPPRVLYGVAASVRPLARAVYELAAAAGPAGLEGDA